MLKKKNLFGMGMERVITGTATALSAMIAGNLGFGVSHILVLLVRTEGAHKRTTKMLFPSQDQLGWSGSETPSWVSMY
jgi:hypothetical protein